jgi:hypothetical protein
MGRDQVLGAGILFVCLLLVVAFVGLLFFYDPYIAPFLTLGEAQGVRFWLVATPVAVAFVAVMVIGAWIGWTMVTTPPPKPIKEIAEDNKTEESKI